MRYEKAQDILPSNIIEILQQYMEGGYIYIPKKEENKKSWGENTTTKEELKKRNEEKAKILYDYLDSSELFKGTVVKEDRSLMNVPFITGDKELDAKFVKEAKEAGIENIKGHRTVGGMRASIYNAMPIEGVKKLIEFMDKFAKENF